MSVSLQNHGGSNVQLASERAIDVPEWGFRPWEFSLYSVVERMKLIISRLQRTLPFSEAERRAAAKKYNMIYEDYEPYHKDGFKPLEYPLGDYPKLEPYGEFSRDPHADYDFKSFKRNWGEPVHPFFDIYTSARYTVLSDCE